MTMLTLRNPGYSVRESQKIRGEGFPPVQGARGAGRRPLMVGLERSKFSEFQPHFSEEAQ